MRGWLSLLALPALAAAAPADWTAVTAKAASGAYVIGNPRARVKLVEYASYTCPHCAAFAAESAPVLRGRMIRAGSVSLEFRHFVFNALDLGAVVLARCAGPAGFARLTDAFYRQQGEWLTHGQLFSQANGQRLAMYPPEAQLRALVDGAGLTAIATGQGLAPARVDACFADRAEIDRITAMAANLPAGVNSTPSFVVNGKLVTHVGWAQLEQQLRAAGAR